MKLSLKLAFLNIRRYPLRTLGNVLCLLIFGFALFSAVTFTRSLNNTVSNALKSRSSGNVVTVRNGAAESDYIPQSPDALEVRTSCSPNYVYGKFEIEGVGELDEIDFAYHQAPDGETLIPNTYFEEFHTISDEDFLVAGRMPENHGEMLINEKWLKSRHFADYSVILDKLITIYEEGFDFETKKPKTEIYFENARIVGIFSEEFLNITALHSYKELTERSQWGFAFLVNYDCKSDGVEAYCSIDKIDRVYADFCAKYGEENVIKTVLSVPAIERLSGFNAFIGNLMYLAKRGLCADLCDNPRDFRVKLPQGKVAVHNRCGCVRLLQASHSRSICGGKYRTYDSGFGDFRNTWICVRKVDFQTDFRISWLKI